MAVAPPAMLVLHDVGFRYGDRMVLVDVSLAVRPGQILGLLGPNGSGKTTLLRLAAGLLPPHRGIVELDGHDLAGLGRRKIARRVALLPQDAPLPATFTGWEIATMGRTPHLGWLQSEGPQDRAIVRRALELVDALDFAERRVGELSGGERQRITLARALAQEPDLLLLDEPTVHLDLTHQLAMLDLVWALTRQAGIAVIAVFHDLNLAAEYCDELVVLANGRVVVSGAPEATLTAGLIREVYGVDLPVIRHPESGRPAVLLPAVGRPPGSLPARRSLGALRTGGE